MNIKQRFVILIWTVLVIVIGLNPPTHRAFMEGALNNSQKSEIIKIDIPGILVAWGTVSMASAGFYFLFK